MRPKPSTAPAAALTAVLAAAPATDGPSLKELMRRVAEYVQAYGDRASLVVATEHYAQRVSHERQVGFRERSMVAELAIVYVEAEHMWLGFRDVSEVDGRRIPDREDRLIEVLTQAQGTYN